MEFIRTGKLRALGITTAKRSEALPDLPAIDDSVKGYEQSSWYGIAAAVRTGYEDSTGLKATPDELVAGSCTLRWHVRPARTPGDRAHLQDMQKHQKSGSAALYLGSLGICLRSHSPTKGRPTRLGRLFRDVSAT